MGQISIGSNKWICLLILGCLTICATAADTSKETKDGTKDKRQIDRQGVVTIGASNSPPRFYNSHAGPVQQEAQDQPTYVTPATSTRNSKAAHYRGPPPPQQQQQQPVVSELPEEYLKLIQQLSLQHQQYSPRVPERVAQNSVAKPRRIQPQPRPSAAELQYLNGQQSIQGEPGVQFITEEEYVKLLDNQKQYEAAQAAQHAFPNHVQRPHQQPQEGLGNFRLPQSAGAPKVPAVYNKYPQPHAISRPLTDFDKELALLVESNKPVAHQAQPLPRPASLKQSQHQVVQIPQRQSHNEPIYAPQHLPPPQNLRYAVPANIQYTPQKPSQSTKPRFESPAQRYQLIAYPQQPQLPQIPQQQQQQHIRPDFQDPQIQFYFPKEKDIQAQQQFQEAPQHLIYETQGVMKIVDPPQLQYQQPEPASQRPTASKYSQSSKKSQQQAQQSSQSVQSQETQRQPTRSQIYVSRTTQGPPIPQHQPQTQAPQQQSEKPKLPPLKIDPNRPLTQEEFQRLVDQGYNVVPVPVPVPYPVHINVPQEPDQDRKPSQSEDPQPSQSQKQFYSQSGRPRHHAPAYRYGQRTSESRNVVTYLQPVASQETPYSGIRGPSSGAIKK